MPISKEGGKYSKIGTNFRFIIFFVERNCHLLNFHNRNKMKKYYLADINLE